MGIITGKREDRYMIFSDRSDGQAPTKKAQKRPNLDQMWTGNQWSLNVIDALCFGTLDAADEYVRANYSRLMAK